MRRARRRHSFHWRNTAADLTLFNHELLFYVNQWNKLIAPTSMTPIDFEQRRAKQKLSQPPIYDSKGEIAPCPLVETIVR